jgi:hypothetical protein
MNSFIKSILLGALLCSVVSTAQAEVARQRFQCSLVRGEEVKDFTNYQFQGFIYPASNQVNMNYALTDAKGKEITRGDLKTSYTIAGETFLVLVTRPDGITSKLAISKDLFSLPARSVGGEFDGLKLNCSLFFTHLPSQAASLPKSEFEKYNLPVTHEGRLPVKTWTNSDGTFKLNVSLINDFVNKKGNMVTGWTNFEIVFLGAVVDNAQDLPQYLHYVQSGPDKRTLRAILRNPIDVQKITSLFNSNKISLNLVHAVGGTTPVNLQIDCTSGSACVITSQN